MITRRIPALVFAVACAVAQPVSAQQKVLFDQSELRFVSKQMNVPVEGKFRKFAAELNFDPNKPEAAKATITIDLNSIDMSSAEADTEVKRKPWFNVELFPQAKFMLTTVKALGGGRFDARGNLALKGVTREISAPFALKQLAGLSTVEGGFVLKRLEFKIGEGEWSATDTVADDVHVRFRLVVSGVPAAK